MYVLRYDDIAHLFAYDPAAGSLTDLGIPVSALAARQYGYVFGCAATGPAGEIYLGQHERVNHLWVYFPPIPRRPPPSRLAATQRGARVSSR